MKENILIGLAVLLVGCSLIQGFNERPSNRYEVVSGENMLTILVDKQTGVTWRNCICNDKSNVPGCWERMYTINPDSYSKPIGEVEINRELQRLINKQQKENAKKAEQKQETAQPAETK